MESRIHVSQTPNPERVTDVEQWNMALARLPAAHVLQTWEWGTFKSRYGWQPVRYLWSESGNDRPRAVASVLTRRLGRWPAAVMYVSKGPALDYGDTPLLEQVLAHLETTARREGALFVKIDPDVRADAVEGARVMEMLRRRGWCASREQIQFRNTILLDLTSSPDELLAAMKSKWRYNVRLAVRKGVTVRRGVLADLPLLYEMYTETATRDGFVIRPEGYYRDAWGAFVEAGLAQPLIAEVEGEPVAMVLVFCFAGRAWYMYGASLAVHRERMPNHLLQWEAMRWAREQGCTVYDMWGAPDVLDDSDPLWGVYRFKRGFGGEFVRHIGAWDFPVSRPGYWLYTNVMPRTLAAMRWRYRQQLANEPRHPPIRSAVYRLT
ncbi:MAG: peptidoglycan bridge formation glycyltransferase FemA/FemB family protein [Chloroflexota bacterium]|nr:peptidoglycan bridge formation glycyltransferase FemA/FemB family protein [Chloroflexota bacterium]